MKLTCRVICDILPLYAEGIASEDSKNIIEEHIHSCENCKKYLKELETPAGIGVVAGDVPLKKLKKKLFQKKMQTITVSILSALLIAVIIGANLAAPSYFPFSENLVSLTESKDGVVYVFFADDVTGYGISAVPSDDESGYAYHIVAWDRILDKTLSNSDTKNVVLNPDGEKVSAVYYYETDGSGEILLYGEQQNPSGVLIKQPNLMLFVIFSVLLAIVCLVLFLIFRKNQKAAMLIQSIFLLPVSYLLIHVLVKGFSTAGYSTAKDFWRILLVLIPVYCVLMIVSYLFHHYRDSSHE